MYKIIALDLDDTLLKHNKEISENNYKALKECEKRGIKIVLATGRPYLGVLKVLDDLKLVGTDTYVICCNGALIYHLLDNKIIHKATIFGKDVKKIYQTSLKLNINFHAFLLDQTLITPKLSEYTIHEAKINHIEAHIRDFNQISDDEEFLKCMAVDPKEILTPKIKDFEELYSSSYSVFRSAPFFLEFLNLDATKGNALKFLSSYLNIDIKDTMSFGDSENDLSMIIEAGMGIAMNNAYSHIKEKADFVTLDCEEDGVAYAINKFILNE